MRGYLNRPEETAKTLVDGWLHTGDVGRFDEDGYLMLVDRAKDMIIRGGENIYPKEIETVVYQLPEIAEAAVVGRAHAVYGEEPVLFVSLCSGATSPPTASMSTSPIRCRNSSCPSRSRFSTTFPRTRSARSTNPSCADRSPKTADHHARQPQT